MNNLHLTLIYSYNNVSQPFYISIIPVDDELPLLVTHYVKVQEGTRKIISQFELEALDPDTKDEHIIFDVVQLPQHGLLQISKNDDYVDTKVSIFKGNAVYISCRE